MKDVLARALLRISLSTHLIAAVLLYQRVEPFNTYYFLFAWWSFIGAAEAWLYLKGGESLLVDKPLYYFLFLVPCSAFVWFVFEGLNLRLDNWVYVNVPREIWIRWAGNFLAFGTVIPGILVTANLLEHYGVARKNEFSQFFDAPLPLFWTALWIAAGLAMLALPLILPRTFFPLVWGGFVLLLDPINALWKKKSLLQEWRQKNWNRTLQLLLAGLICGGLWELWNFWAGAKWIYTVLLPEGWMENLKLFEMPVLGFLGFPPFALECFVMADLSRALRERTPKPVWGALVAGSFAFSLAMCRWMDASTIRSFR